MPSSRTSAHSPTSIRFVIHRVHRIQSCATMNVASLRGPVRTAALGSRLAPSGLMPFRYPARSIPRYQFQNVPPASPRCFTITASTQLPSVAFPRATGLEAARTFRPSTTMLSNLVLPKTASRANSTSEASSTGKPSQSTAENVNLDWNSFFKLRTSRRRYSLVSSIITATATTSAGMSFLATQSLESLSATFLNLDPFLILGISVAVFLAVGWLIGPFLGNAIWGLVNRRYKPAFTSVSETLLHQFL